MRRFASTAPPNDAGKSKLIGVIQPSRAVLSGVLGSTETLIYPGFVESLIYPGFRGVVFMSVHTVGSALQRTAEERERERDRCAIPLPDSRGRDLQNRRSQVRALSPLSAR
jgi:hypothetical protein